MNSSNQAEADEGGAQIIKDDHHLMRFVPLKEQIRNPDTNEFEGILGTAFKIRPCDEGGLSVTWVEHYGPKTEDTYAIAGAAFRDSLPSKKLPKTGYFAIGKIETCRKTARDHKKAIRFVHEPDGSNTGHVTIRKFSDEDRKLLDALAIDVFCEHVSNVSLKI